MPIRRGWNEPTPAAITTAPALKTRARCGADLEPPVVAPRKFDHFFAEMELRLERLDLLHQPVHELLCTANGHRRDVVNGLLGIKLRALAARNRQGIDEVRAYTEQPKLKDLEQAARAGTDDHDVGGNVAQSVSSALGKRAL